ncbi:MAG TPA: hypothetical protein PKM15_07175, partial [bacterium]|nr:hypothetical protein [bacterium]
KDCLVKLIQNDSFTLENGHIPKHAIDLLREMKDKKEIEGFSYPKIGYDQIFNKKEIVEFKVVKK